jgi:hypothetical protein
MLYLFVLSLVILLIVQYDFLGNHVGADLWFNIILVLFIGIAGLRYKVGGDTLAYIEAFKEIPKVRELTTFNFSESRLDPLWIIVSSISRSILDDFTLFQIVHALFVNIVLFKFIKRYTPYRFTAILIYYVFFYLYFNMEILRESLAVCIFLLAYPYYQSRRWLQYYVIAAIAFLFHTSALLILFFPLLRSAKLNRQNVIKLCVSFVIFSVVIFKFPNLINFLFFSSRIASKFESYSGLHPELTGMLYYFFFFALMPYLMILLGYKLVPKPQIFEELFIPYFAIVLIFIVFSGFGRFLNYLSPFLMIYFSYYLHNLSRHSLFNKMRGNVLAMLFVMAAIPKVIYYTGGQSKYVEGTNTFNRWYPYSSIFTKEEYPFREIIYYEGMNEASERQQ